VSAERPTPVQPTRPIVHPESVVIVALDGERAVLVRQRRAGADAVTLELPAGCLEPGEDARAAAVRELREECSLAAASWRALGHFWAAPAYSTEFVHAFEARGLRPAPGVPEADEQIEVQWRRVTELQDVLSDATSLAALALWRLGA
jgi:ADP-ribose pyrophosphatase